MSSKPAEYTAFLPNTLLTVVNSKAFIPFILSSPSSSLVSLAALAASQHQRHAELLALPASTSLADVLSFFRQYDITAVPILSESRTHKKGKFSPKDVISVFTMQDLIRPLIFHPIFDQAPQSLLPDAAGGGNAHGGGKARLGEKEFLAQLADLAVWKSPVSSHCSCSSANRQHWFLRASQTVRDAAIALSSGLRHVLVTEGNDIDSAAPVTIHMLSAGDLARFMYTSLPQDAADNSSLPEQLSELLASPVSAHLTSTSIVAFQEHELTINAFRRLASVPSSSPAASPIGAVPIVNSSHMVIDNLSATDLRLLTPSTFRHILDPLSSFLSLLRPVPSSTSSPSPSASAKSLRPAFAATVNKELSMQMMLEKTVNLGISRIWVVDEEAKPVGVISLSDLFRLIVGLRLDEHLGG